jgi:hypothetical protein
MATAVDKCLQGEDQIRVRVRIIARGRSWNLHVEHREPIGGGGEREREENNEN